MPFITYDIDLNLYLTDFSLTLHSQLNTQNTSKTPIYQLVLKLNNEN